MSLPSRQVPPLDLPVRLGPRPLTYKLPPHTQLDAEPVPELVAQLAEHCFSLPHVHEEPTQISVPGARALVADRGVPVRSQVLMVGGEFAHIHPDGSMHVVLPADDARAAIEAGWAEPHPMAAAFSPGMVMLYSPRNPEELAVVVELVDRCWSHVFGLPPAGEGNDGDV